MDLNNWTTKFMINKQPDTIKKANFIRACIVGPSDTGKSYLFKHLANEIFIKHYDIFVVFCGSKDTLNEYRTILNTDYAYQEYNEGVLDKLKEIQNKLVEEEKPLNRICVVYDDFADRKTKYDKQIFHLAISGRHDCMSFVFIMHDLVTLDRIVLDQLTHMFITKQQNRDVYEKITDKFLQMIVDQDPTIDENHKKNKNRIRDYVINTLNKNTGNYYVIVCMLEKIKKKPDQYFRDYVYKFKAK